MRVVKLELRNGLRLAARWWDGGDLTRPTVVLLPATAETASDWDAIAEDLSHDRLVVALNLRGHGASDWPGSYSIDAMAEDVRELLARLDGPVDLVGHSLGGLVAWWVAAADSSMVRRLVLEDVGLLRPRPPGVPPRPDGELDFDWAVVEQVRPEIDNPDAAWPARAGRVHCKTLVIGGGADSPVPQEHVADLVEALPDGHLVTIEAGHLVHAARPSDFLVELRRFLDS
jgi:pimeloyl-ACP methyl ester carboxylesterase